MRDLLLRARPHARRAGVLSAAGVLLVGACALAAAPATSDDRSLSFTDDIKPILANHCYECHGPDKAEGGLRLTSRELAFGKLESGRTAIVPGEPGNSELVRRVTHPDPDERMPRKGEPLTDAQVRTLRDWIAAGAPWEAHWAYRPIERPDPPAVGAHAGRVRNPIDRFVLARLEQRGIHPSPEADRYTLIKRLYYDLLGLPPEPEAVDRFVSDEAPDAYERLVDRLLASPHFGERWGRHWLDKARYADSDGYEKDRARPNAWRWRDWVIDAINADMPFDRFTIEQLAGDLLPDATAGQELATAFHRQTLTNTEGGTDPEEFRVEAVVDRVNTTGAVWLGLTIGCARCHNHKYDRISQEEFYEFYAFFNNGEETNTRIPVSEEAWESYERRKAAHTQAMKRAEQRLEAFVEAHRDQLREVEVRTLRRLVSEPPDAIRRNRIDFTKLEGRGVSFERQPDHSYRVTGPVSPKRVKYRFEGRVGVDHITGFRLDAIADPLLPKMGPGRHPGGRFTISEFIVEAASNEDFKDAKRVTFVRAESDHAPDKNGPDKAVDGDIRTGWSVAGKAVGASRWATFWTDQPLRGRPYIRITMDQNELGGQSLGRFRITALTGTRPGAGVPDHVRHALSVAPEQRTAEQHRTVRTYLVKQMPEGRKLQEALARVESAAPDPPLMTVRVIGQNPDPRETHVLERGDFLRPGERITAGVFGVLHEIEDTDGDGELSRLDLARWLMDGDNPLTPRVLVNHVWGYLFGEGLVNTMNDFGVRGDRPTHPQLLDWLASEYRRLGWSRKALIRRIVTSGTYRQSSRRRPDLADVDPLNRLLYRQNRFRVEAEIVRDLNLAASGLLAPRIGGPSVYPPQPPEVAALSYANNYKYNASEGADRYRRGLYTFFKRTAPHPNLTTFDCPDSNTTTIERNVSNTPLQALTLLNNEVYVESARAMAMRLLDEAHTDDDTARLVRAVRLCVARPPTEPELANLHRVLETSRKHYRDHPSDAGRLIGSYAVNDVAPDEQAAWVAVTRVVLNLDEFVTRE